MADSRANKDTEPPERFVGVADLARIYGWKKSWIYKQVQAEAIPFYKNGHYVQFRLSQVEEWVASRKVEPSYG